MNVKILISSLVVALLAWGSGPASAWAQDKEKARTSNSKAKGKSKKTDTAKQTEIEKDPYGTEKEQVKNGETEDTDAEQATEEIPEADRPAEGTSGEGSLRRSNRMEFDERLVKGQAAKSGAVYLFQRTPRRLPGLVPMRRSYRSRIVQPILGERQLKPVVSHTQDKEKPEKKAPKKEIEKPKPEPKAVAEPEKPEEQEEPPKKKKKKKRNKKKKNRKHGGDK